MNLVEQAIAAHRAGRLGEAEALYRRMLERDARAFDALHMLGILCAQRQKYEEAERLLRSALSVDRRVPPCLHNYGNVLSRLGRYEDAIRIYDEVSALAPNNPQIYSERGNALAELGRLDEALASYAKASAVNPNFPPAHYNRGNALAKLKRYDEALASYDRAIALNPDYAPAHSNRGEVLRELGSVEEAVRAYGAAERANRKALQLRSDDPELLVHLALALINLNRFAEATAILQHALALNPDNFDALKSMGRAMFERGEPASALDCYRRALALKPNQADIYCNLGNILKELGRLQEARDAFCKAIEIDPNSSIFYSGLAESKTFSAADPHLAVMESIGSKTVSKLERIHLDFALGKAYADIKDYHRSFKHLLAANAAKRATVSYDEPDVFGIFDRIERVFSPKLIGSKMGSGDSSRRPIFVLGMPRSGTTLVEQLLASHPAVHGAGELPTFKEAAQVNVPPSTPYPDFVPALDGPALRSIGADYVKRLAALTLERERITDKMPSNFLFGGLIHLTLPNAVIIHTVRNPVDTCVSCFSKLFRESQHFTYDLGELGRYYVRYYRLMEHWRRVLPAGRILDVRYEDVVSDLEAQARRILAHCGLPWDDRLLSFHATNRPVRTASATQVRQPIYRSAVDRWRVYEEFLEPLLAALGPLAMENRS